MAETKFTQGPWFISKKYVVGPRDKEDGQSYGMIVGVADVYGDNRSADTHLIAAAPELYEAANVALSRLQLTGGKDGEYLGNHEKKMIEVLSKALAKARGEAV